VTTTTLLCTDGSEIAINAIKSGLAVLAPADRTVVVTVIDSMAVPLAVGAVGFASTVTVGTPQYDAELDEARRSAANVALDETMAAVGIAGQPGVETVVLEGDPGRALCEYAERKGATVLVMGTRGRGGLKRAMLGSVSDHVVRNAPCPVMITTAG
jgi:nucleotide-binding universal stress UspA family protein